MKVVKILIIYQASNEMYIILVRYGYATRRGGGTALPAGTPGFSPHF